jgi:glycosyltransferase involved in cell wall biosynthesis
LAALEAAAQGRPLALTEVGSTREYFGAAAAYLRPESPESIAQAIEQALKQSPAQQAALAAIGPQYTWPRVVQKLQALYEQL